jgi:hypothetical protein
MRGVLAVVIGLVLAGGALAGGESVPDRYGVKADLEKYPQANPREALRSVLKAIKDKRIDYLLAHLADPVFVDDRVKRVYAGRFAEQVEDTRTRLDPFAVRELRKFAAKGKWDITSGRATVTLDDYPDRRVYLRKRGGRWFLEHRNTPPKKGKSTEK